MGKFTTETLTEEQFIKIMSHIKHGFSYSFKDKVKTFRPNQKLFITLLVQGTTGLRIGDVIKLEPRNIVGSNIRLIEEKTQKEQFREISDQTISLLNEYIIDQNISPRDPIINRCSVRNVQKNLKIVTDHLGYENISTHSFRKYYGTSVYKESGFDIELVRRILNHSSVTTTQKYLGISKQEIDTISKSVSDAIFNQL